MRAMQKKRNRFVIWIAALAAAALVITDMLPMFVEAREVAVSALGTVYALSATADNTAQALAPLIAHSWSLATALSLLAWYVFAPQCFATLAAVKRETGGWTMPLIMAGYLFALAYVASFLTYRLALAMGAG